MLHKLDAILADVRIGDCITYSHEGVRCRGEVHGWRLCNNGYEHRAIVGNAYHDHEVSLSTIVERRRETLHGQETVTF